MRPNAGSDPVKVSARAEYACVAMVELAIKHPLGQPVQIKNIAQTHGISPRFLVQILLQLKAAGLVAAGSGFGGMVSSEIIGYFVMHQGYLPVFFIMAVLHPLALIILWKAFNDRPEHAIAA